MSVPNQTPYNIYTANGLTTVFAYEFYLISAGDIQVTINGAVVTGGYSVGGVGNVGGGDITFLTPPANDTMVMLERNIPTYRLTDYQDNGDLLADTVNKDFDRLWMAIQRAFIYLGLALTRPLLGGPFNAKGYRIENLGYPVNNNDAANKQFVVDNGHNNLQRTLRVPEASVPEYFPAKVRANMLVGCNNQGHFVPIAAQTDTADLAIKLAASTGASLIGGLGFRTPEMEGAVGDGTTFDTEAVQKSMSIEGATVLLSHDYLVEPNIIPAANVKIIGNGRIISTTEEEWMWSSSDRASPYPALLITNPGVTIEGITIESKYEAIQAQAGGDNLTISLVKGGGTGLSRAKSSAFVFFEVNNIRVLHCEAFWTGKLAVWDSGLSRIVSGGCDGVDFGGVNDICIINTHCHDVGRNGINWYGASNVYISGCKQRYCGQSGIQPGPHPDYSGVTISDNDAEYCCADAIDIRYTGSGIARVSLTMDNCRSDWIGMLYGDVNYAGVDGTGVATIARVDDVTLSNCSAKNTSGVIMWLDAATNVNANNIQGESSFTRYGVGLYTSCNNIRLDNFNIKVKGPALWHGGSSSFTDVSINASHFESYDSYSFLMPNNSLNRYEINNSVLIGYRVANINFSTNNVKFILKASNQQAVYMGSAYQRHLNLTVSGNTSEFLLNIGLGTGVVIDTAEIVNSGSGSAARLVSAVGFKLSKSRIFNTGSSGGTALSIAGGQNNSVLGQNDIYSASGYAINSTATHTDLTLENSRENGALGSFWSDKTNVYRNSKVNIT
ncbi:TPA: right-handed parallel beta-helix repeat-containing protein [Pluralibacter gergoviae]|uniref:right-handed parallel beta-helix repeat-containing protein n=1 Tax=Pluralibacter gergoviae TaxID=61647 RepID=UPI00065078BB|nr:right-handed parallel beta-helix repeat-containing protein [Pluralibacter gergoviae]KMK20926.1 hypothetical protein ABW10_22200 [Pluralibacter gergoviae]HDS1149924.1 right-handed parallel beta-helix repeat-containing protein [Pluralibacter gergoviae]